MLDNPDLLKALVALLWHWEAVEPRWMAEASFRSVGDVSNLAESQSLMAFPCLFCGVELQVRNRDQLLRLHRSSEAFCSNVSEDHHLSSLLCKTCLKQRDDHDEAQRHLDQLRQQALLDEYRKKPYVERRRTREWAVLKRQIHHRDGYRCRLCGRNNSQLHVHHSTYKKYGEERLEDLITLCRTCHERFHFSSDVSL
jgi:HNH endonuclease